MKVLLINNYFPPEIGAASHLYYYLAKEFIKRGHEVTVLTGIPRYNVSTQVYHKYYKKGKVFFENVEGISILRVRLPLVDRKNFFRRGIEHFEIAYKLAKSGIKFLKSNYDVSLVYSPPLTLYWTAEKLRKKYGLPYILNVQDLFPQAVIDLGHMKNRILINIFRYLEKKAYESANLITVHSETNAEIIKKVVKNKEKVVVFENWVDDEEIQPGDKDNEFSRKHSITDKFVVSFAGTLGYSQDIEVIMKAAYFTKDNKDIVYLIVGDGPMKDKVMYFKDEYNLTNVLILPAVPKEIYPLVLHSSDVSLATLKSSVKTPVVPSKILSIMSAGIPVIAVMNKDGDAPRLVEKAHCGIVVDAGDAEGLARAILQLYYNDSLRVRYGRNGRKYIEKHLSVKVAAEKYEKLFKEILGGV